MSSDRESLDHKEYTVRGVPASGGIAIGECYLYKKPEPVISEEKIDSASIATHLSLFEEAKNIIETELIRLKRKEVDDTTIEIIDAQIEMVHDPDLDMQVRRLVQEENHSVDFAIREVFDSYLQMLEHTENHVVRERVVDVEDIRDRLIQITNNHSLDLNIRPGSIVVAEDVSPREVIQLADYNISGLVSDHGGKSSHASIIARSMGIPSVVGTKRASQLAGAPCNIIVDGNKGTVIIDPEQTVLEQYREKIKEQEIQEEKLRQIITEPSATRDGIPFKLRANIEFAEELGNVRKYGAEGIGLLRTESIYIRKDHFEDQEKQVSFYSEILEETDPDPVTIRLFDAGGDKFFSLGSKENNPFLGWRGIRMLLDERDLLREQLRAILLVAGRYPGRVQLLVPMVTVLDEVIEVKEEMLKMQGRLTKEGEEVDDSVPLGIMVEVPSVAIMADKLAAHVDYFSVGSNDLTQYTLAVDRGNELISELYQQVNPAVFELIYSCVKAARNADIEIAVCGEMASYPRAAACLMGMGITDLSMSPASIPKVKTLLREHTFQEMEELARQVLDAETVSEVNRIFNEWAG